MCTSGCRSSKRSRRRKLCHENSRLWSRSWCISRWKLCQSIWGKQDYSNCQNVELQIESWLTGFRTLKFSSIKTPKGMQFNKSNCFVILNVSKNLVYLFISVGFVTTQMDGYRIDFWSRVYACVRCVSDF